MPSFSHQLEHGEDEFLGHSVATHHPIDRAVQRLVVEQSRSVRIRGSQRARAFVHRRLPDRTLAAVRFRRPPAARESQDRLEAFDVVVDGRATCVGEPSRAAKTRSKRRRREFFAHRRIVSTAKVEVTKSDGQPNWQSRSLARIQRRRLFVRNPNCRSLPQ